MNIITKDIYNDIELLPLDLQGWSGINPIFEKLIEETKPKHIIEVGTWKGQSAITMANSIKKINLDTKITCVDTWLGAVEFWDNYKDTPERNLLLKNGYPQIYYQFISNVIHTSNQDIIIPFPNTSRIAYYYFKKNNIKADLIYIDASHEYEDVKSDIEMYYELLNDGGVIFGDDYTSHWSGVIKAVDEFGKPFEVVDNNYWVMKK